MLQQQGVLAGSTLACFRYAACAVPRDEKAHLLARSGSPACRCGRRIHTWKKRSCMPDANISVL